MLDLNNLLQNSSVPMDSFVMTQETDKIDGLSISQNDLQDKDEEVDPSSFIVLMSEMVSNNLLKVNTQEHEKTEDSLDKSVDELSLLDNQDEDSDIENLLSDNNVALAWIDSENFKPVQGSFDLENLTNDDIDPGYETKLISKTELISSAGFNINNVPAMVDSKPAIENPELLSNSQSDLQLETTVSSSELQSEKTAILVSESPENILPVRPQISDEVEDDLTVLAEADSEPYELNGFSPELIKVQTQIKNTDGHYKSANKIDGSEEIQITSFAEQLEDLQHNMSMLEKTFEIEGATSYPDKNHKAETPSLDGSQNTSQINVSSNSINVTSKQSVEPKTVDIAIDINNSQWAEQFSERIVWLGNQGIKSAQIKIHPEDLGPLEINIEVVKDAASVNIIGQNSHVRDVVEQALPRLREMMADQGLTLSDVHVSSEGDSGQSNRQNSERSESVPLIEESVPFSSASKKQPKGLIDYFA